MLSSIAHSAGQYCHGLCEGEGEVEVKDTKKHFPQFEGVYSPLFYTVNLLIFIYSFFPRFSGKHGEQFNYQNLSNVERSIRIKSETSFDSDYIVKQSNLE